jgi:hypothetical protein
VPLVQIGSGQRLAHPVRRSAHRTITNALSGTPSSELAQAGLSRGQRIPKADPLPGRGWDADSTHRGGRGGVAPSFPLSLLYAQRRDFFSS